MKTLSEIIKQEPVYLNDWKDQGRFGVISDFEDVYIDKSEYEAETCPYSNVSHWIESKQRMNEALDKYKDINILLASYGNANWSGDAFVLFEQDGKLFEVHGSHCSCYGLEEQWKPEEVSLLELEHRLLNGTFGEDDWSDNRFKEELCNFLGVEFKRNSDQY